MTPAEIGQLNGQVGKAFGSYRKSLLRTQIHAEAIAALQGEDVEQAIVTKNFAAYIAREWAMWKKMIRYEGLRDLMQEGSSFD